MFHFSGSNIKVAGVPPKTLVKLMDGVLHTFPLTGTRPRSRTEEEDTMLEEKLLYEKEFVEHNVLVDLGRNDPRSVSRFGIVRWRSTQTWRGFPT